MKNKKLITICTALVVSACSSSGSRDKASGDFEYLETKGLDKGFQTPDGLKSPVRESRYIIPAAQANETQALLGDQIKVSSPRLVLPLVAGSHIEEGSQQAKVLFDQIDDSETLDKTVWDKVLGYLEENNIGVENFDKASNTLTTDWVVSTSELDTSWYDFTTKYSEKAKKFNLNLVMAPHGRTASLTNEMIAYMDESGNAALSELDSVSKRNAEVDFLNFIITEYDFNIRLAENKRFEKIRNGFDTELGTNNEGDASIVVKAEYNNAWPRLLLVLRKMGFDVIDLDQSSGIMFVAYNGIEESWFSGWFSADKLKLAEENYRIFVEKSGDETKVTFKDDESVSFESQKVDDIFPVFAEYMASDNLDI